MSGARGAQRLAARFLRCVYESHEVDVYGVLHPNGNSIREAVRRSIRHILRLATEQTAPMASAGVNLVGTKFDPTSGKCPW
jgi:hypothetical protein